LMKLSFSNSGAPETMGLFRAHLHAVSGANIYNSFAATRR
jgi:hypothetical protein